MTEIALITGASSGLGREFAMQISRSEERPQEIWAVARRENRLEELHRLGYPLLLGTSRKSVIGLTLHVPARERLAGTIATTVLAVQKGCAFVRVHDVKENREAVRMTEAVLGR